MASIQGIDGMSYAALESEVQSGGRFVCFEYCISLLVITLKRSSSVYYLKPGQGAQKRALPFTALSLLLGWWGIPWGFIYTPMAIATNLRGGRDVTPQVMTALTQAILSGSA